MATSQRQATTTDSGGANHKAVEITPAYWCSSYFCWTTFIFLVPLVFAGFGKLVGHYGSCYLELFAHSVSVSNANVSTADWRIGLSARSPVTGCKISLHTIKSRLLRGHDVISELSTSPGLFGQLFSSDITHRPATTVDFKTVVTPEVIGGVVWDIRVEIVAGVRTEHIIRNKKSRNFLMVVCGDIPVKFTADPAGNVMGSLLGNMRRCDYLSMDNLDS